MLTAGESAMFALVLIFIVFGIFYGLFNALDSDIAHRNHDRYVRNQEVCAAHHAWYVHREGYHGLISCHRLSDHSQFYVVPDTGLALEPVVN